jgi:hypothetical protein
MNRNDLAQVRGGHGDDAEHDAIAVFVSRLRVADGLATSHGRHRCGAGNCAFGLRSSAPAAARREKHASGDSQRQSRDEREPFRRTEPHHSHYSTSAWRVPAHGCRVAASAHSFGPSWIARRRTTVASTVARTTENRMPEPKTARLQNRGLEVESSWPCPPVHAAFLVVRRVCGGARAIPARPP